MQVCDPFDEARIHPRWDEKSLRVLLSREEIEQLPVKIVDRETRREVMMDVFFNPVLFYPKDLSPLDNEIGYDNVSRYVYAGL